jgi:hypothetical protein
MKTYWGVELCLHVFLTSALGGVEWSVLRQSSFSCGVIDTGTHLIGGWVDPRACLDAVGKTQNSIFAPA